MIIRKEREIEKPEINITLRGVIRLCIVFGAGFLVGRVNISDAIWPFGAAYILAAFLNANLINPYVALAGVLTALATEFMAMDNPAFNFTVVAICSAIMIIAIHSKIRMGLKVAFGTAAAAYIVCTIAFKLTMIAAILSSLIELAICILMVAVLNNVINLACERRRRTIFSDEEIISVVFVGLLAVLGFGNVSIQNIYLCNIVAIYITLMAAYIGGAGVGAAAGIAGGFACVISGIEPVFMANLGMCGMVAGTLKKLKKPGVTAGFVAVNTILTFYINSSHWEIIPMMDTIIASVGFIAMPKRACEFVGKYVDANLLRTYEQGLHMKRFRQLTVGRLKEIAKVFANAASVFSSTAEKNKESVSYMIAGIPENACAECMFFKACWDDGFSSTYTLMRTLYEKYEEEGAIGMEDFGAQFMRTCISPQKVLRVTKEIFKRYNTDSKWENKVLESRAVVGDQMFGVARVIEALGEEVQVDMEFKSDIEEEIRTKLDAAGVGVKEVCAEACGDNMLVDLKVRACTNGLELCNKTIKDVVSDACGMQMTRTEHFACGSRKHCMLHFEQARAYSLVTGIAGIARQGSRVSGDAHSFEGLKDGRYMLLLCDGMGSGERAARESSAAVSLMEDFYHAGFDDETILNAINKLLILSSSDDIYSTMDLCMVNLIDGSAKFTKIGAPHSYLIRGETIKKLGAGSLPIGILDEFKPAVHDLQLVDGDMIVMWTDGIADLETSDDTVFESIMQCMSMRNVQEIADSVLALAVAAHGGEAKDDMTVMITRVLAN